MSETIVEKEVENKLKWAEAMMEWLLKYDQHIEELCRTKQLPKPPQW